MPTINKVDFFLQNPKTFHQISPNGTSNNMVGVEDPMGSQAQSNISKWDDQ